jgi:hypothetical protein
MEMKAVFVGLALGLALITTPAKADLESRVAELEARVSQLEAAGTGSAAGWWTCQVQCFWLDGEAHYENVATEGATPLTAFEALKTKCSQMSGKSRTMQLRPLKGDLTIRNACFRA